ncbi:MAG: hypothetical protein Q9213_002486 [Squamulea squamosa]
MIFQAGLCLAVLQAIQGVLAQVQDEPVTCVTITSCGPLIRSTSNPTGAPPVSSPQTGPINDKNDDGPSPPSPLPSPPPPLPGPLPPNNNDGPPPPPPPPPGPSPPNNDDKGPPPSPPPGSPPEDAPETTRPTSTPTTSEVSTSSPACTMRATLDPAFPFAFGDDGPLLGSITRSNAMSVILEEKPKEDPPKEDPPKGDEPKEDCLPVGVQGGV